jgi:hypothetical protein
MKVLENEEEMKAKVKKLDEYIAKEFGEFFVGYVAIGHSPGEQGFPKFTTTTALGLRHAPTQFGLHGLKVILMQLAELFGAAPSMQVPLKPLSPDVQ